MKSRVPSIGSTTQIRSRASRAGSSAVSSESQPADGSRRPHHAVEETVLGKNGAPDLFEDRAARLARAWRRLEAKWGRAGTGEGE